MRVVGLAILLATVAAGAVVCASARETDRELAELLGRVKSVRLEVLKFDTYTGKLDTERMPQIEDWYDRAGNLVEEKYHTADFIDDKHPQQVDAQTWLIKSNMGDKRRHRTFDSTGALIEETIYTMNDSKWEVLESTRFEYDSRHHVIETDDLRDGKIDGFTLFKRDARDNLMQLEFHYNDAHSPFPCTWHQAYKFDRYGNWTERHTYSFDPESGKPTRTFAGIDYPGYRVLRRFQIHQMIWTPPGKRPRGRENREHAAPSPTA